MGDWQIHGLPADIDIRCTVELPDGRQVPVPVTVKAVAGRFYFEPDQDTVLDAIRDYWQMVSDQSLYGFSVIEGGRRVDPRAIGQTALPPGVCVTHGSYSGSRCPRCSTAVGP